MQPDGDMWAILDDIVSVRGKHATRGTKVKGHATDEDVRKGLATHTATSRATTLLTKWYTGVMILMVYAAAPYALYTTKDGTTMPRWLARYKG